MKITIEMDAGQKVVIERDTSLLTKMVKRYPEVSMMRVNEELDELGKAITKGVINGKPKKLVNIDEEIIMWVIARFNVTIPRLQEWEDEKGPRYVEREKKDLNVFRTEEARDAYWKHSFVPENTWGFQRTDDGLELWPMISLQQCRKSGESQLIKDSSIRLYYIPQISWFCNILPAF